MKKLFLMALSFGLAFSLSACSDDSSSNPGEEGGKTGEFSDFKKIDENAQKVLDAAVKGTDYESAKCSEFATQLVAGTNYKFKCTLEDEDFILEIFEDLDGNVKLGNVPSNGIGEFSDFADIDEKAGTVLKAAIKDTKYASAECSEFATQLVAGTNYKFKCSLEDEDIILKVFEDLKGNVEITGIESEKAGDFSDFADIDEKAQKVLKAAIKDTKYASAECSEFATQVVAGTNYKFKCSLKDEDIILVVFEDLDGGVHFAADDVIPSN